MVAKKKEDAAVKETQKNEGDPVADAGPASAPSAPDKADEEKKAAAPTEGASTKSPAQVASPGRIVLWHRESNSGNGVKMDSFPGIVIGQAASESNLPAGSVDLSVFTRSGMEVRHGVMFSAEPKAGHYSWPPRT